LPFGIKSILTKSPLGIKAAELFIEKSQKIHGIFYDYSQVEYDGANKKVEIICPTHGSFQQTPSMHTQGNGCPNCYNDSRRKRGEVWADDAARSFVSKAQNVHGQNFDYSKVNYIRSGLAVEIICQTHGSFFQAPSIHLQGVGCNSCKEDIHRKKMSAVKSNAAKAFEDRAKKIHHLKYDYSKSHYVDSDTKLIVTCKLHGDFQQTPNKHLAGQGCPKCREILNKEFHKKRSLTAKAEFAKNASIVHAGKYGYQNSNYIDARTKLTIHCPVHGEFEQTPDTHLSGGGCIKCRTDLIRKLSQIKIKESAERFPVRAAVKHDGKYDYSKVAYFNKEAPVTITCPMHGDFQQSPNKHLQGNGCPQCAMELNLGEDQVAKTLAQMNIEFERQFTPSWGKKEGQNRYGIIFDFAIHELKILFERDGEQHYFPVRFGGISKERADALFAKQILADTNKTNLAKKHGWKIYRIPYFCEDISNEIKNCLDGRPSYPDIPEIK